MSIHKLTAGSGYEYLTRQVAALDATDRGGVGLSAYYSERGEAPGVWLGSGLAGVDGLEAWDPVAAEQMKSLFGQGLHPLASQDAATGQPGGAARGGRLGQPFNQYRGGASAFRVEVARRVAQRGSATSDGECPATERAAIRTAVAREMFQCQHGRDPLSERELAGFVAKNSRPKASAVAGYDLTFSPVKSVSTLWALADTATAAEIEMAHGEAVADAIDFIEQSALYTRMGKNGVRQVDVTGLLATAFVHRDSRSGDPDLHTHLAVSNKVQSVEGPWLAIDGRVLFKATVAASETYNSALERHLHDRLGVRFSERPFPVAARLGQRPSAPVREVIGIDPALNEMWSSRRAAIDARLGRLSSEFQLAHGRPPTPVETIHLAQQANLETREKKHEPRAIADQRRVWREEAVQLLGSDRAVQRMLRKALNATATRSAACEPPVLSVADRTVAAVESRRATWQVWHVRAEAHRQLRAMDLAMHNLKPAVDHVVAEVLSRRSVALVPSSDGIEEPAALRRADGSSVYSVAGATQFTSPRLLAAEQRLVEAAGEGSRRAVEVRHVEGALLESAANGVNLNASQAELVRQMACSGRLLQLAIAPAGSGKTTAMRALAAAWNRSGGQIVGLAPSAAASAVLRDQIAAPYAASGSRSDVHADTLAMLAWSISNDELPTWAENIGPNSLVIIDEAGMADTMSLASAVAFVNQRGGSVRLVGDDQQLAAVGAGGVLRDIEASHGALRLHEVVRFQDPAEAAATLALRAGRTEALGFYLDRQRIHVGSLATITEGAFTAWLHDQSAGLDSIMVAPTREQVADLNRRAREERITAGVPAPRAEQVAPGPGTGMSVRLADENLAGVGDVVLTRTNDRRLHMSPTDWVKNGDRWRVLAVHPPRGPVGADLTVRHLVNQRVVRLPASYVAASTELGYATTVHAAQGVSADTMHGIVTGQETRQLLYTMLSRGRAANHVYLESSGVGDPHNVIRPDWTHPKSPTEILEHVLERDGSSVSAISTLRKQSELSTALAEAVEQYLDALSVAATEVTDASWRSDVERAAESIAPGVSEAPAWPTLLTHLALANALGLDAVEELHAAARGRGLATADDVAAVLDWRLDDAGVRRPENGPLPWAPGIPDALRQDDVWGTYLTQRCDLVERLAKAVAAEASEQFGAGSAPWEGHARQVPAALRGEVTIWRATMRVDASDRRPTGPPRPARAEARWQRHLDRQVAATGSPATAEWSLLLASIKPSLAEDPFSVELAERLAAVSRAGGDAVGWVRSSAEDGPLPDDHAAAALWWRVGRHLGPAAFTEQDVAPALPVAWERQLLEIVGTERAEQLRRSRWWPALVTTIEHDLQRGWALGDLLSPVAAGDPAYDECQLLTWRAGMLAHPAPLGDEPPDPLDAETIGEVVDPRTLAAHETLRERLRPPGGPVGATEFACEVDRARLRRWTQVLGETDDRDVQRMHLRALEWDKAPVERERMLQINDWAAAFFESAFPTSWAPGYLVDRLGQDLIGDERFRAGHAPAGWTSLVDHLGANGVTQVETRAAGLALMTRNGRTIDRFRDRLMFPITRGDDVLGFIGRRAPSTDPDVGGPKYLNTPATPLFHKADAVFGLFEEALETRAIPVLVEGPLDAVAVTLATAGTHVGVAALGTAVTEDQALRLSARGPRIVVATDADPAGLHAARRDFWILAARGLDPHYATLPSGSDPADLFHNQGPAALSGAVRSPAPLVHLVVQERLDELSPQAARRASLTALAAADPTSWDSVLDHLSRHLHVPRMHLEAELLQSVRDWEQHPLETSRRELGTPRPTNLSVAITRVRPHAEPRGLRPNDTSVHQFGAARPHR